MNQQQPPGRRDSGHGPHESDSYRGESPGGLRGQGAWGQVPHAPLDGPQGRPVDLQQRMAAEAQYELSGGGAGPGQGGWGRVPEAPHAGAEHEEFDPEYLHWREQQLHALDEDYRAWRQDRYRRFADEFTEWRARRAAEAGARGNRESGG